jgi:LCP family protein required for cell wall assembly
LLVGIDERPDNPGELVRSDSIIVLHVPATHDQAYLVSVPRDLLVEIPAFPENKVSAHRDKINAAFALGSENDAGRAGGFKLLALTIKKLTGLEFNAGAIVDFGGFQKVVEQLGGVDMCIDQRVVSHHIGFDKKGNYRKPFTGPDGETRDYASTPVVYEPGCRHLKPWEALDYVRQRKGLENGDYDRQRHQQQFLKAILKEAKKQGVTSNPLKAIQIINAAGKALTVDTQGVGIDSWAYTLRNVTDNELVMLKTNGGKVNSVQDPTLGSCELLTDESVDMFKALRSDTLANFVYAHPDFINADGTP